MSKDQYEGYLQSLDPQVLKRMGVSADDEEASETESKKEKKGDSANRPLNSSRLVCYRCHSILHHSTLDAGVARANGASMFPSFSGEEQPKLKDLILVTNRIMVVVVDLVDFPLSLPRPLIEQVLRRHKKRERTNQYAIPTPVILVGNKFDLLPHGTVKEKVIDKMRQYLRKHDLLSNVYDIQLVSAKHPSGDEIQKLIRKLVDVWPRACKGSVIIVGAENVGKSQLLNAMLMEGVRKGQSLKLIEERDDAVQKERQRKLNILMGDKDVSGGSGDDKWGDMTGNNAANKDLLSADSKSRGVKRFNDYNVTVSNVPGTTAGRVKVPLNVLSKFMKADYDELDKKWIVDTPGFKHSNGQIADFLTLEEIKVSLPSKMIKPMSFTLEEGIGTALGDWLSIVPALEDVLMQVLRHFLIGKSIFMGGLVRIDCISVETDASSSPRGAPRERGSNPQPKITLFTSLPIHKTSLENADKFMKQTALGELNVIQPPFGTPERLFKFPGLAPAFDRDVVIVNDPYHTETKSSYRAPQNSSANIDPYAKLDERRDPEMRGSLVSDQLSPNEQRLAELQLAGQYGICDFVFSGLGWAMVSGKFSGPQQPVTLRVWTPMGQGAMIRDVCLLPELAANPIEKTAGGIRQAQKVFQELPRPLSSDEPLATQS